MQQYLCQLLTSQKFIEETNGDEVFLSFILIELSSQVSEIRPKS